MDLTYAMTGILPAIILISIVLTAVISVLLLWLYRRATLRGMGQAAGATPPIPQPGRPAKAATPGPSSLAIRDLQVGMLSGASAEARDAYRRTARSLWATVAVYTAGGLACALVITLSWMVAAGVAFKPGLFLYLLVSCAWPSLIALGLIAAVDRWGYLRLAGAYFALLGLLVLYILIRSPAVSIGELVSLWLFFDLPGTILLLAFLRRRVRAVGPLVLAFTLFGVTGTFIFTNVALYSDALREVIVAVGVFFGFGGPAIYVLMLLLGFALFGVLGWWFLGRVGRHYRAKRLSDQSLTLDALWLLFALTQSFTLVFEGWGWIFTGPLAFAAYKLLTLAGFAFLRRRLAAGLRPPMLLLLRVFALGPRSERFFDAFSRWWRRSGGISLISGPDLVTAVVEPHEFLDFVSGRLSRQFVQGQEDLERRLAHLDRLPDPDGLYRVNEFFCHADTWQMTMGRLARESDAVLMDLRSFSSQNRGSLYELGQLLDTVDLERVVFLVDDTTDRSFLEATLHRLWHGVASESPNRRAQSPAARLFHAGDHSGRLIRALLLTMFSKKGAVPGMLPTMD